MTPTLLQAQGLTAGYGKMPILHDVTLDVRVGEMVSIIGPNGAGKSTALKSIIGFVKVSSGHVRFDGQEITGLRPDQVLPRGLAYVPQAMGSASAKPSSRSSASSPSWASGSARRRAPCRAASSRWWPSPAPS